MPEEIAYAERSWVRWRGTPSDIAQIASRINEVLTDAGVAEPRVRTTVTRRSGTSTFASSAEAVDGLPKTDVADLESIAVNGGGVLDAVRVTMYFFRTGPLLKVEGRDAGAIMAVGVRDDIAKIVDRGDRSLPHERALILTLSLGSAVLGPAWLIVHYTDASLAVQYALGVPAAVVGLFQWGVAWIRPIFVPRLEVLPEGKRSRAERWGGPFKRLIGQGATLIIGGLLGVFFDRHL